MGRAVERLDGARRRHEGGADRRVVGPAIATSANAGLMPVGVGQSRMTRAAGDDFEGSAGRPKRAGHGLLMVKRQKRSSRLGRSERHSYRRARAHGRGRRRRHCLRLSAKPGGSKAPMPCAPTCMRVVRVTSGGCLANRASARDSSCAKWLRGGSERTDAHFGTAISSRQPRTEARTNGSAPPGFGIGDWSLRLAQDRLPYT